jgi:hypothetical protein
MKKVILAISMLATVSSYAKLTEYSNADALKLVLSDIKVMDQVSMQVFGRQLTSAQVSVQVNGKVKSFAVRLAHTTQSPIGPLTCFTDVAFKTQPILHSGISGTGVSALKVSKSNCEK